MLAPNEDPPKTPVERVIVAMDHMHGIRERIHLSELAQLYIPMFASMLILISTYVYERYEPSWLVRGTTIVEVCFVIFFCFNTTRLQDLRIAMQVAARDASRVRKEALAHEARMLDRLRKVTGP